MQQALELRKSGLTYYKIAQQLEVSVPTVQRDIETALSEITRESAEQLLVLEAERIDALFHICWEHATDGDMVAMDKAIKLIDRRMHLFGLDTQKHDVSVEVLDAIDENFSIIDDMSIDDVDPENEF